ncbi:GMC family oxidoreductase N-terminal domain-containing protein [Alphaproteobacteria bacterium]|nr:GMC family oxidoreductase N-terminal domain-containing protein [Alphaproteobacteria bacterium]
MKFDYVIAGGGSAGCALAARLAEDPSVSVCIVEAGGKGKDLFIRMPAGNGFVFGNPKLDWGYHSEPQAGLNGRSIYFARGKALGGSSIVNGMIYMRGVAVDYEQWRQRGLTGWGYADVLPYFKRAEGSRDRRDGYHGADGPLKTEPSVNFGELDRAFIEAAKAAGHRELNDFNGPERTGVARTDSTVSKGIRQSAAIAYLAHKPRNLTILTHRQIAKIVMDGTRAVGVETLDGSVIRAEREVIVCQGAFGTPQLLMLSGIGPADHLLDHGIKPVIDAPDVGSNLADHVDVSIQYASDRLDLSYAKHQRLDRAALLMGRWLLNGSGPGGGALFSSVLFHALEDAALPELQVYMTPMIIDENIGDGDQDVAPLLQRLGRKLLVRGKKVAKPGIQIDINQERPKSLGTVRLRSSNPAEYPLIDPNYFSHPSDVAELVKGVHAMREVMAQREIAQYHQGEIGVWKDAKTDAEILHAIRETAYTGHHVCSTARMGTDLNAVLDGELRVRGAQGLRVCDASAMPSQITGNLYATVVMMAEKAADMILQRLPLPPEHPSETHHV